MNDSTPLAGVSAVVLATANPGKISEMKDLLADVGAVVYSIADFDDPPEIIEDQPDLAGNALKKARAWFERTGITSVADDTGLEVPALGGAPGVFSARYAGEDGNADANMTKLLREMHELVGRDRRAQFRTVVAVVSDSSEELFHGVCTGLIAEDRRGDAGFGYDPIFVPDTFDKSFAELTKQEKNRISHRGKAVRAAANYLHARFGSTTKHS
jgi:XTP/dITP diphosphohydrolase